MMVSAASPLMAPDSTLEPGIFDISYGSPVRYDSSMVPCPSTTTPSTGQISWGKMIRLSPIAISPREMSVIPENAFRCAVCSMRFARASSTDDARRVAWCSRAAPPESIKTMIEPTRYCPRRTAVRIEMPASRSEPNSRANSLRASVMTSGNPPATRVT